MATQERVIFRALSKTVRVGVEYDDVTLIVARMACLNNSAVQVSMTLTARTGQVITRLIAPGTTLKANIPAGRVLLIIDPTESVPMLDCTLTARVPG